MLEIVVSLTL